MVPVLKKPHRRASTPLITQPTQPPFFNNEQACLRIRGVPPLSHRRLCFRLCLTPPKRRTLCNCPNPNLDTSPLFFLFRETLWFVCLTLASSPSPYKTAPGNSRRCRCEIAIEFCRGTTEHLILKQLSNRYLPASCHNPYTPTGGLPQKRLLRFLVTYTPKKTFFCRSVTVGVPSCDPLKHTCCHASREHVMTSAIQPLRARGYL